MKKKRFLFRPYLPLAVFLLLFLSLPSSWVEFLRNNAVKSIAPFWKQSVSLKNGIKFHKEEGKILHIQEEIARLSLENRLLKNQLGKFHELLTQEQSITALSLQNQETEQSPPLPFRKFEREKILESTVFSLPAQVVYRSPAAWNNTLWIDVGEKDNERLARKVVAKNSPVVIGCAVVGLIDEVGSKESRVRLITDPQLTPSVRVVRVIEGKSWYLAKGELKGSKQPEGRTRRQILYGTGFNYDFSDKEGPARDLVSGKPFSKEGRILPSLPIVAPHDWLITSGMDGAFPPGLFVAKVHRIEPLKEGDYFYELEAIPCCGNLDDLTLISVLPPVRKND